MFINVSNNICCTNYIEGPGLSIQSGRGAGVEGRESDTWASPDTDQPHSTSVCAGALHSGLCGPCLCSLPAAATIASTTFHLLIISNEPEV